MINIILPGLAGTVLILAGLFFLRKSRATSHWRPVGGTIVEVAIETSHANFDIRRETLVYRPVLHYKYVVNGVLLRGSEPLGVSVSHRTSAVASGREYIPGQPIDVFVDERHPHRHALERGMNHQYWWLVALGMCWIGVAVMVA